MKWINVENRLPKTKMLCRVLVEDEKKNLKEELAIYYLHLGTFYLREKENKETKVEVLYWRREDC